MKIGLISDIHGNLIALEAALHALKDVDQLICLGDVVVFGPQPRQALECIHSLGCPVVMGNTDEWILRGNRVPFIPNPDPNIVEIENWCADQLTAGDLEFIDTFKPTFSLPIDQKNSLLCFHGSPRNIAERILAGMPDEALKTALGNPSENLLAGGHTHIQMLRRLENKVIINPGSVGHPLDFNPASATVGYPARAEFAVIQVEKGEMSIEFRRAAYTVNEITESARSSSMPCVDWWIKNWITVD